MSEFPGLDSWIEGDRVCSYCGMHVCICEPEAGEGEQAMSTDALREERLINILMRVEREMGCSMTEDCVKDIKREFEAALAAPAGETDKLPAKWMKAFHEMSSRFFGSAKAEHIANAYRICAEELEAALKADRQGGMR